jgi:hypothetical protein
MNVGGGESLGKQHNNQIVHERGGAGR